VTKADPLVSIVIPTKNRRDLLRETLASIFAQTFVDWEVIVVDDGSDDGTEEMMRSVVATEPRVRYIPRERRPAGGSVCRNIGAAAARGKFVLFMDSDDLLAPSCLEVRIKVLEKNPAADAVIFLTRAFKSAPGDSPFLWNKFTEEDDLDRFLRTDMPWHTSGPLWRRAGLARIGRWDELARASQDWEFHIRAIAAGLKYIKVPEVDSFWREAAPGSTSHMWIGRRQLFNRARLFGRSVAILRGKNLITEKRRQILAAEYYKNAFEFNPRFDWGLKVWRAGYRAGIVKPFEFAILLASEFVTRCAARFGRFLLSLFFPGSKLGRTHWSAYNLPRISADSLERLPKGSHAR
jgi:glycosyltransferase involved in cell wall biosynthesis